MTAPTVGLRKNFESAKAFQKKTDKVVFSHLARPYEMRATGCSWHKMFLAAVLLVEGSLNSAATAGSDSVRNRLPSSAPKCTPIFDYVMQGRSIFRELCDVCANFKVGRQYFSCSSVSLEAVNASYGYMCGEGYKLSERYATCFAEVETDNKYLECRDEASAAMTIAQEAKIPNNYSQYFEVTLDSLRVTMTICDLQNALL
ncbi:unnamed protein product [Litomosoides sigmodontis]|uniref:DUF19 domain-containing protein n=1 Tax=Litomosoides sigmodontis TaxID=42156 RepID=A0A3P6SYY5_LITSI|nr:unnamed protein product [Litomosoides sigmodontis]